MRILVAGGAGYIGSHTVKLLLKEGFDVTVLDNFSTGRRELLTGGELVEGDLSDRPALRAAFAERKIDAVMHFASLIQVGESYLNPQKYYRSNLITSLNLLEAMLDHDVRRFIFSSSAAVYGLPEETPIPETHPLKPINPYGRTKLFVERILEDYDRAYDLRSISLRYFNAAGADPDGELGEMHDPETHLIPNVLFTLLGRKKILGIFGEDFPTPDGTALRDYVHVSDLAAAHVLALRRLLEKPESLALNLGSGRGFSVMDVVHRVEAVTGREVPREVMPRRKGDPPVLLASNDRARSLLGWKLLHSDMDTIIRTAWTWHSKIA